MQAPSPSVSAFAESDAASTTAWLAALSIEERRALLAIKPWRSCMTVASNWVLIFAAMAMVAWRPNPLTVVLALCIIGSRQLGLAIVMHEAAHRTLFAQRGLNDWVGNWLGAYPIWAAVAPYRAYHLTHHAKTGTAQDPDLGLAAPFPITPSSFRRKVWRDLSGQTGLQQALGVLRRDLGVLRNQRQLDLGMHGGERRETGWQKLMPVVITNGVLLALVSAADYPALYLLWVAAWLTTYRLVSRIRSIAEHGMVPDLLDPLRNTRTTLARWWERLFVAPNRVNYHLEHHLMMTVPHYNLPQMHRLLCERGVLTASCVADGYAEVLRQAVSRPEPV